MAIQLPTPMCVRYVYAVLFLVANILAWVVRQSGVTFLEGQRRSGCRGDRDCLAAEGVLIISLATFMFFLVMFLSTVCTSKVQDPRNSWHCQWWPAKLILLAASVMASTFTPSALIQTYGQVAPFGAGVFLFVQLMSGIRLVTRLNHKWCLTNYQESYLEVMAVSITAYGGSMVTIILMSLWHTGCWLNIVFIATTALLVCIMPLIALKTKANGFFMEPGLVGAYSVYLCWSAIKSEPETDCYSKGKAGLNFKTLLSFVAELVGTTYAVFSTGKDYKCLQLRNNVALSEEDVPYGYGFFHSVFAVGSMYFGMLFVGWDTHHTMEMWSVDVSWTSAWVHIVNEALTVISFVAILLARIYGIAWLQQLLARIFGIGDQHQQQQPPPPQDMNIVLSGGRSSGGDDDAAVAAAAAPPSPPLSQRTVVELDDDMVQSSIGSVNHGTPPPSPVEEQEIMSADTGVALARNRRRNRNDDAAGASSSSAAPPAAAAAAAGAGWRNWRIRLTMKGLLACFFLQATLICLASLFYMLYNT